MSLTTSAPVSIIDSHSGSQLANTDKPFILALKQGENLFEGILRCAEAAELQSASLSGLGGLDNVTIAFYNLETKQYQTKLFTGMHELISLNGNLTWLDGKRFLHIHVALGTADYSVIGGHLMDARVNPSAEISIIPLPAVINRKYDAVTGLKIMCPLGAA